MPCETKNLNGITQQQRNEQVRRSLVLLEALLAGGQVNLKIGPTGAIVFQGWSDKDRDFVSDVCAYRALTNQGSTALRRAVVRAQAIAGRTINQSAIAAGSHSHDGGTTWSHH